MISEIKCYIVKVVSSFLGEKTYEKCDITNQLEQPIYDTGVVDGTLDMSKLSLLRKDKEPLPPLTRIILEIVDDGEVEKIYRVVDNDVVTNVVKGRNPVYRHSLDLLEPTKILERRDIDNLSFTNYLPCNYGIEEKEVKYTVISEANYHVDTSVGGFSSSEVGKGLVSIAYSENSERFVGPYINIEDGNKTISTNVRVVVKCKVSGYQGITSICETDLSLFYVETPNNTKIDLMNGSPEFVIDREGEYVFKQVYTYYYDRPAIPGYPSSQPVHKLVYSVVIGWTLTAIKGENKAATPYTIKEVVERILEVGVVRMSGTEQEFVLDSQIQERLQKLKAPEFSTGGTLFEALCQVGNFFNAIPRLIPSEISTLSTDDGGNEIITIDDYSKWNKITFDFLGDRRRVFSNDTHSLIDTENPLEVFASEFVSDVQNISITNSLTKFTISEPYEGGVIAPKTESADFEISDNECIIKTRFPIRKIKRLIARRFDLKNAEGQVTPYDINLSDIVVEKAVYDSKKIYIQGGYDAKINYLYYEEGSCSIRGLTFTYETSNFIQDLFKSEAIDHLIDVYKETTIAPYSGKLKDLAFFVEYIPYVDSLKTRQTKSFVDRKSEKSTLYYNQQETELDVERFGKGVRQALLRTGNIKKSVTTYYNSLKNIPAVGDSHVDKYKVFQLNREIMVGVPVKASVYWSKYYNELDANVGIQRSLRQFEISEKQSVRRNINFSEYVVVDNILDVAEYITGTYSETVQLRNRLKQCAFGCNDTIELIHKKLDNEIPTDAPTCVTCTTKSFSRKKELIIHSFLLPALFYSLGNSICVTFAFNDTFAAATYSADVSEYIKDAKNKAYDIESWVEHSNEFGRFESLEVRALGVPKFYDEIEVSIDGVGDATTMVKQVEVDEKVLTKELYQVKHDISAKVFMDISYERPLILDKDSREKISVTCQLNFVSTKPNIILYSQFVDGVSFSKEIFGFTYVIFKNIQSALGTFVNGEYTILENSTISSNNTFKYISIDFGVAQTDGAGYGIITDKGELCLYVEKEIAEGQTLDPIYLMFRQKI